MLHLLWLALALAEPMPPHPHRGDTVLTEHGISRADPWYWLRDRDDPAVARHLRKENRYAAAMMKGQRDEEKVLFDELMAHVATEHALPPVRHGAWLYWTKTESKRPYPTFLRRPAEGPVLEQVVLDVNALDRGGYLGVGILEVSPDHARVAYGIDRNGREVYQVRLRDIASGVDASDVIDGAYYGFAWSANGQAVFYTKIDEAHRPYQVWRHTVGTAQSSDVLVYQEDDDRFNVSVLLSRNQRWVLLQSQSAVTTEWRVIAADAPESEPRVLVPRKPGVEVNLDVQDERFVAVSNDSAFDGRLLAAPLDADAPEDWTVLVPEEKGVTLESVDAFRDYLVVAERRNGASQLLIVDGSGKTSLVPEPDPAWELRGTDNRDFAAAAYRFRYSTPTTPWSTVEWNPTAGQRSVLDVEPVPGLDPAKYRVQRISATAPDGTKVPATVVVRADLPADANAPLYLQAYGAYGASWDPGFDRTVLPLLDRGVVVAIAHVRGGGELGRRWKEDGKLQHKQATLTDFIAVAETLADSGLVDRSRMSMYSVSAGGLLVGGVLNRRPELFRAAIADVPFVDLVTTMLDQSIPLTAIEWEEWGDPRQKADFDYMLAYSPYDNVRNADYPDVLVTAGWNDPRVAYWEPAKWVARLRDRKSGDSRVLLVTEMGAGHAGASGLEGEMRTAARNMAFVLDRLGVPVE